MKQDSNESPDVIAVTEGILIASLKSQIGMLEAEVEELKEKGCRFDCRKNLKDHFIAGYQYACDKYDDSETEPDDYYDWDASWDDYKDRE